MRSAFFVATTLLLSFFCHAQGKMPCINDQADIPVIAKKKTYYAYTTENQFILDASHSYSPAQILWLFGASRDFITFSRDERPPNGCCGTDEFLPDLATLRPDRKLIKQLLRNFDTDDTAQLRTISAGKVTILNSDNGYIIVRDKNHFLGEAIVRRELIIKDSLLIVRTIEQGNANGDEIKKMFGSQKFMKQWWKLRDESFFDYVSGYHQLFDISNSRNLNQFGQYNPPARCRVRFIKSGTNYSARFSYTAQGRIDDIDVQDSVGFTQYRYTYNDTTHLPEKRISSGDTAVYLYNPTGQLTGMELRSLATPGRTIQPTRIFINPGKQGESSWTFPSDFGESHKFTYRLDSTGLVCIHSTFINYESRAIEKDRQFYHLLNKCGEEVLHPFNGTYGVILGPVFDYPVFYFNDATSATEGNSTAVVWRILQANDFGYPTQISTPKGQTWTIDYDCL
jgi:hypothetical protein